jgi:RimJ/RimL family protein N-acetyltransferase
MLEIVTERLVLRLLEAEDVPAFAAYRRHPDIARYPVVGHLVHNR